MGDMLRTTMNDKLPPARGAAARTKLFYNVTAIRKDTIRRPKSIVKKLIYIHAAMYGVGMI